MAKSNEIAVKKKKSAGMPIGRGFFAVFLLHISDIAAIMLVGGVFTHDHGVMIRALLLYVLGRSALIKMYQAKWQDMIDRDSKLCAVIVVIFGIYQFLPRG